MSRSGQLSGRDNAIISPIGLTGAPKMPGTDSKEPNPIIWFINQVVNSNESIAYYYGKEQNSSGPPAISSVTKEYTIPGFQTTDAHGNTVTVPGVEFTGSLSLGTYLSCIASAGTVVLGIYSGGIVGWGAAGTGIAGNWDNNNACAGQFAQALYAIAQTMADNGSGQNPFVPFGNDLGWGVLATNDGLSIGYDLTNQPTSWGPNGCELADYLDPTNSDYSTCTDTDNWGENDTFSGFFGGDDAKGGGRLGSMHSHTPTAPVQFIGNDKMPW